MSQRMKIGSFEEEPSDQPIEEETINCNQSATVWRISLTTERIDNDPISRPEPTSHLTPHPRIRVYDPTNELTYSFAYVS